MITSLSNEKVKLARSLSARKNRSARRQFLVEGVRAIEEAERAGMVPALVFFEPKAVEADSRASALVSQLQARTPRVDTVSPAVLSSIAQTETPQGIVAIYPFPDLPLPASPSLALVLDAVRDPGNLGTILRTAWAAGADAALLAPGSADPYNPKVVRAAMGAHFSLPIRLLPWLEIAEALQHVPRIYLADARATLNYTEADWAPPRAIIVGGEAEGASEQAKKLATAALSIPMPGHAESLNAAVASAILLFEAIRPRV